MTEKVRLQFMQLELTALWGR